MQEYLHAEQLSPTPSQLISPVNYVATSRHRHIQLGLLREGNGFRVAGVDMASYADSRIVGQHPLDALCHFLRAIRDGDLAGVLRVADADAAPVMNGDPGSAARSIYQRVQQRPVRYGIGPVEHGFRFAVRRRNGAAVQMITPNHNWRFQLAARDEAVEREAELVPLPVP